jgi:lipopolysaccharide export system ATP-binding protein
MDNLENKKKIKIKASLAKKNLLLLKKEDIIHNETKNILLLNKEILTNKAHIQILNQNIIKLKKHEEFSKSETILSGKNISKKINDKPILKKIDFSLKKGEILGLLGPNGAGKSTLFNLIVGKTYLDSGNINFFGKNINNLQIHERALEGISLLEQHKGLFGKMTAKENLFAILELFMNDKNKIETEIMKLLSYFGLQYLLNVKADNMSGGEYKKLSILQRVCNKNIKVLLLDEPMAALDPLSISSLKKFILDLKKIGLSIIITDHNFFAIHDILDNCIIIKDGTVMIEGKTKKIMMNNDVKKYYLGSNFKTF